MAKFDFPERHDGACAYLDGAQKCKIAHNTTLRREGDDFVIRYHKTDIVTFRADGRVVLDTGGWDTATTRERIRACGIPCFTRNGVTSIAHGNFEWLIRDGMTLYPNGTVSGSYPEAPEVVRARIRAAAGKARRERARRGRAIAARRSGNFADRALLACGPTSSDAEADCRAISRGERLTGGI